MSDPLSAPEVPEPASPGSEFRAVVAATYDDLTPAEQVLLDQAVRILDVVAVLDAAAAAEPIVQGSAGQPIPHPAYAEARLQRRELARTLDQLGLPDPSGANEAAPSSPAHRRARKAAESRWARVDARRAMGGTS